mgnify:CR=1 FL=1
MKRISLLLLFLFVFLRWIINTAFFDVKDIEADKKDNLKTFPVVLGNKNFLRFIHILNLFSFSPIIIGVYFDTLPSFTLALCLFYFYSFLTSY